jgi:hypothetical protein
MQLHKKFFATGTTAALLCLVLSMISVPKAFAATYAYNPSDLIVDNIFTNSNSMSASAIQTFLNKENSGIKGLSFTESCDPTAPPTSSTNPYTYRFTYYPHCGKKESAATIIYDAGRAYGINPQAIMATMQKEQSLITTPHLTGAAYQASLNCALGYNSCSGFKGFFSQVDNGTWQLRTDVELMSGRNWWGYAPSSYPCSAATSLYSTGLYPDRTVKFADPGGKTETVKLANASTAALYCYTPYVGPYSVTGYSGSYNFVQSFEAWFGPTTLIDHYDFGRLAGSSGATNQVSGSLAQYTATITTGNKLHVFYYDDTNGYLRESVWDSSASKWTSSILDGAANTSSGGVKANVGEYVTALDYKGSLQLYYYDVTNGNLRHAWWSNGRWSYNTMDGSSGAGGKLNANVGEYVSAMQYGTSLQLYYYDVTNGNLRHAWWSNGRWSYNTMDGSSDNVGTKVTTTQYKGTLYVFYYDATTSVWRVDYWYHNTWYYFDLDGSAEAISNSANPVGGQLSATAFNSTLEMFYRDSSGSLRHSWATR